MACFSKRQQFFHSVFIRPGDSKIEMEHSLRHGRLGLGPDGMPLAPWPPLAAIGHQALILQRRRPSHPMTSSMSKVKPTPLPSNSDTDESKRQVPLRKKWHPMATFGLCQAKLGMLHLKSPTKACYDVNTCEIHCETHHRNLWRAALDAGAHGPVLQCRQKRRKA